jgi:hypothetical protein
MRLSFGLTAGTEANDTSCTPMIQERFAQNAARGIAGAEKEHTNYFVDHVCILNRFDSV